MLTPIQYLKAINLRSKLEKAIALQVKAGLKPSIRVKAELNWVKFVLETHYAAKGLRYAH